MIALKLTISYFVTALSICMKQINASNKESTQAFKTCVFGFKDGMPNPAKISFFSTAKMVYTILFRTLNKNNNSWWLYLWQPLRDYSSAEKTPADVAATKRHFKILHIGLFSLYLEYRVYKYLIYSFMLVVSKCTAVYLHILLVT